MENEENAHLSQAPGPDLSEEIKSELENLRKANEELKARNEDLYVRLEALQDSLESALEELSLRSGEGEKEEPLAEAVEEAGAEEEVLSESKLVQAEKPVAIEKEIEKTIKEEEEFRKQQEAKIEDLMIRYEAKELEDEINAALARYPNASREEILYELENMTDEEAANADIMELAQASHEKRTIEIEDLKSKLEGELRTQLQKEMEGGISVPQSSGAPPAPRAHAQLNEASPRSIDAEWDEALRRAKVEG